MLNNRRKRFLNLKPHKDIILGWKCIITVVLQIMDSAVSLGPSWARRGVSTSHAPGSRIKTCFREELWGTQMDLTTASTSYTSHCRIPVRDELFPALLKLDRQPHQTKYRKPFSLKQVWWGFQFFLCCCVRQSITCCRIYDSFCQPINVFTKFWAALLVFMLTAWKCH